MQVIGVQLDIAWEDPAANFAKVQQLLSDGVAPGSLVVLPEMFTTGFTMNVEAAVREHDRTVSFVKGLSKKLDSTCVAGISAPGQQGRGLNQAIVADASGEIVETFTKLHPFTPGGESEHYHAGDKIVTFKWHDFTVAPFV